MNSSHFLASILLFPTFVIAAEGGPTLPAQPDPSLPTQATGFYHVENIGGVDWVVAPAGRAMTVCGIDHVRPNSWKDRNLGYDIYGRFVETNYPSREAWVSETLDRLGDWGFNTLANHCDEPLLRGRTMPHTITLYLGGKFGAKATGDPERWITPWSGPSTGIPNVFHPDFEREIRKRAHEVCAPERGNPWLLGWFLDNELKWWGVADNGRKDLALYDTVAALPTTHSARKELEKFGGGREAFLRHFADRYFSVLCSAIRAADPDHMILGCRFAGPFSQVHPVLWEVCGKYCDIVSFNCYPWADIDRGVVLEGKGGRPVTELFAEIHGWSGKPLMVTEWSFPALDTGRPCLHGAGQRFRTQAERARAAALYARLLSSLPFMAGHVFFMFLDQPVSGISETFREDSNYGLINEFGVPYPEITAALRAANRDASRLHLEGPKALASFSIHEDGTWFMSGADVRVSGAVGAGPAAHEIAFDGNTVGSLFACLEWKGPAGSVWTKAARVTGVEPDGSASAILRCEGEECGIRFAMPLRLTLAGGDSVFTVEILGVENTGDGPIEISAVFLMPTPAESDPVPVPVVPNLWGAPAESWWRLPGGGAWGAVSRDNAAKFRFWVRKSDGSVHPDARFRVGVEPVSVPPGEAWRPAAPFGAQIMRR